jgi:hypothetical protein
MNDLAVVCRGKHGNSCLEIKTARALKARHESPEEGTSTLLRNVGVYQSIRTAPKAKRSSYVTEVFGEEPFDKILYLKTCKSTLTLNNVTLLLSLTGVQSVKTSC